MVEEVKFLKELVRFRSTYQYTKEHAAEDGDKTSFPRATASVYRHGLGQASFAERALKVAHWGTAIPTGFETLAQTPEENFPVSRLPLHASLALFSRIAIVYTFDV